eukprot:CAMPEP_0168527608 /NCGR_PEP_ID=MMETSP0405-20121227/12707_1 /TAXON_ID=498012 /ORGANISM="Trichosphaerium sp, Strain Am-I-7 wt" /LENGTH=409 /DNA_ID=CAMNT_0008550759 /DNA_START=41 /DNA_END=1270 /DNA_ORIENTATION=+
MDVEVTCKVKEFLFNRLQWYNITLSFADKHTQEPALTKQIVRFAPEVTFVDGRRRDPASVLTGKATNSYYLNIAGSCASTGERVVKCAKCCVRDKEQTTKKRKRNPSAIWADLDTKNNAKLIQVQTTGEDTIDDNGELSFKLRVGCCVGVAKQHHINQIAMPGEEPRANKRCQGLILKFTISRGSHVMSCEPGDIIRVLGKVTTSDRKKYALRMNQPYVDAKGRRGAQPKECQRSVGGFILGTFISQYEQRMGDTLPVVGNPKMAKLGPDMIFDDPAVIFGPGSSAQLQRYVHLAIGALLCTCHEMAGKLWTCAETLLNVLLDEKLDDNQLVLVIDSVTKMALYQLYLPRFSNVADDTQIACDKYIGKAKELMDRFPEQLKTSKQYQMLKQNLTKFSLSAQGHLQVPNL